MRRRAGAAAFIAVIVAAGAAAHTGVIGGGPRGARNQVAIPAGSTQFVIAATALASGVRRIDPNCYLPASTRPVPAGAATLTRLAVWRAMSNPRETTITTPPEATSAQNGRVLFCLRQRGLMPQVRVGNDFRTN
jgi:hypothetical protein